MKIITCTMTICIAACLTLAGCGGPVVTYGDPGAVETLTIDFGSTDLQMIAEKMVNSLLVSGVLAEGQRPVMYVAEFKNRTDEHIDTKNITDKIRTALLRSGKVRFSAAMETNSELVNQLEYQTRAGMVRPDTAKQFGQQIGADYFLFGEITSIRKRAGRVEDVYFKFTMNLVDIESALIEWADEQEIRKGEKRRSVGR
jgi:uncharacterized protein (TIGR02722 family)